MTWVEKGQPTPFDYMPIEGLIFLDGDQVARFVNRDWTKGQKCPLVIFPSGVECELWEARPEQQGIVHIFGEMDLPLKDTRDGAYQEANNIAEQCGYLARKVGTNILEVWGHEDDEHIRIIYDESDRRIADIIPVDDEPPRAQELQERLLDEKTRSTLPPLYSGEEQGLEARALVKFFTPDSNWTWYASEFDGKDTFFGLVSGYEIELGYFTFSELASALGPMGLAIERDRSFSPKTLRELREKHNQERADFSGWSPGDESDGE